MANPEHLEILKRGVEAWNKWRGENPDIRPDLRGANLRKANLNEAKLYSADLSEANLINAYLVSTHLVSAKLVGAELDGVELLSVDLSEADLSRSSLLYTSFSGTHCQNTDFTGAKLWHTIFDDTDLSLAKGLDAVCHRGPSIIGIDTLYISGGNIPESFLRGCGVPDTLITFARSLVGTAIDFYSCFISYSSKNHDFANRLYADLQSSGVRCWFAPEDLKIGDRFQERIEESIRVYDKLLIILSEESISSRWVEREVNAAFENEEKQNKTVLFPVRLDEAVMDCDKAWAADVRRSRHIGDFTGWKDNDAYQKAFNRLLRDLKAEEAN